MARIMGLLLCICMLLALHTATATETANASLESIPGYTAFGESKANLEVLRVSPGYTSITLDQPNVVIDEAMIGYETYNSFDVAGEPYQWDDGSPAVPHVTRFYRIPNTGSVDLLVTAAEYDVIENVNPFPVMEEFDAFTEVTKDLAVYSRNEWYPASPVKVSEPAILRDFRVVTVTMYPVQVNPVTRQARIYRRLSADLVANDTPGANELLHPHPIPSSWLEIYRSQIANLDESDLLGTTSVPGTYLIITKNTSGALQWADSLFRWRTRRGYKAVIESAASWSGSTIMSTIQTKYNISDPPLEWVCLVGDPSYSDGVPMYSSSEYDHKYACVAGTDDVEDIAVGRLCGENLNQMAVINAKIMQYEREPYMADTLWYHKAFLYAGTCYSCASNYTLMQWASRMFRTYTAVNNITVDYHTDTPVNSTTIINQINGGVAFFIWRGCWIGGMSNSLAGSTSPNHRLPITFTVTCSTGDFEQSNDVSESWLQAGSVTDPKGGVCGIGTATAGTHPPQNYTLAGGLMYNIVNLNVEHLGTCLTGSKLWLHKCFGLNSTYAINFSRYCNLQGDPGLSIWTDVPEVMSVSYPTVLNIGARQVAIQVLRTADNVPIEDALVCLWKRNPDSTWVKGFTNAQGQITLPVTVRAAGEMMLTVTKRNHKPYLVSIPCSQTDQMCMFNTYLVDDDNAGGTSGNADGVVNAGETIDLSVSLKNSGSTGTATGVSALLTSATSRVQVITANSIYPNIAANDSAYGSTPFRIQIAADTPNKEALRFTLQVTTTNGQTNGTLELTAVAGDASYSSYALIGGALDPGATRNLTVTIRNSGNMALNGVTGRLVSLSPFVQITDVQGSYGDMAIGASATNSSDQFAAAANTLAFRGHQAPMMLILTSSANHIDTVQFTLPVGTALTTDPTGPDTYGYYAYDNTDVSYELAPTFNYVNISAAGIGTNLNISDAGEHTDVSQVWTAVRRLPFRFKFYGQVYDTVTFCSNGWIAFGNQANLPLFRNYPIPSMVAPEAMIAPYWDDLRTSNTGQGVWMYNDTINHRFIVQWKGSAGGSYGTNLDFEVMLYDTTYDPTLDGNGKILMQYNVVSMNLSPGDGGSDATGCSIGIQAPRGTVGLPYVYQSTYSSGAATIVNGRAILFTSAARLLTGNIVGKVLDAETNSPMTGVCVAVDGYNFSDTSDASGQFSIPSVLIGTYSVTATFPRYNDFTIADIVIEQDSTDTLNFSLTHPEILLSSESIIARTDSVALDTTFSIINNGNGPLDYSLAVYYAGDENPNPWDSVGSVAISNITGDFQIKGCEFVNDQWWITGGGGASGPNMFYHFDRGGHLLSAVPQPTTTAVGWFDMAYDGQYVYGSDSHDLVGVDLNGDVQVTIPSPINPSRAVAHDSVSDHFWVADYSTPIYEIDRAGTVIHTIPNTDELQITGMAWNPADANGYKLYIFSQDGNSNTRVTRLKTADTTFPRETVIDLSGQPGDRSGGCTITPGWNSVLLVFAGIFENSTTGDRLQMQELTFNTTWISLTPMLSEIVGGGMQDISLRLDPSSLINNIYRVSIQLTSQVLDTVLTLPISLTVDRGSAVEPNSTIAPREYVLRQNYPNPFNPTTVIRYELAHDGPTRLAVYNLLGEKVTELVNERQAAGSYTIHFDASALPSGMYFYRLESGSFIRTAKMVLMK
jgi:hypothetical protein